MLSSNMHEQRLANLSGIQPLDMQLGVPYPRSTPEKLHNVLFGNDSKSNEPRHTYAIIDAAKVVNLPEMLETSSLKHRCLFTGQALEDLQSVAPWLVRLSPDTSFTRSLFTAGPAPLALWDTSPGIFIRSESTMQEVWNHYRKFTKILSDVGPSFYFRFWDPTVLRDIFDVLDPITLTKFVARNDLISCLPDGSASILSGQV